MRTIQPIRYLSFLSIALLLLTACRKDNVTSTVTPSTTATPAGSSGPDLVLTPAGLMARSNVHFIAPGYVLSVEHGRLQKLEASSGRMIEDFGEVKRTVAGAAGIGGAGIGAAGSGGARVDAAGVRVAAASGWIAYAYWSNPNTGSPITDFTTNWVVPSVPSRKSSQTIFLFNGLQDGTTSTSYIVQPVLQWGPSAAGGGKYWSVTNWYVSSSQAFFGTLVNVSAGASLQGVIKQTAVSGSSYSYNSSFTGYSSASALQVNNVPQAFWAAETLESYGVSTPSTEYPPNSDLAFSSIQILQGTTNASISWTPVQAVSGSAQKAVVVSNASPGGQVDVYFR